MLLDTAVVDGADETDEEVVGHINSESLYKVDSFFGASVDEIIDAAAEVTTNRHDKTDIAESGLEKNGDVPDVNGFDDDAPESSDGWSRDTKNGSYEGSTVWWLLKWLIENHFFDLNDVVV